MSQATPIAAEVEALRNAIATRVVGQRRAVDHILVAVLAGGHVLLEGVPGVAKTLLARTLADALGLTFRRVQFTPDLMPADIVGTNVFDFANKKFSLQRGPVFTHILLADEINRTPPKTQAALLEAMQERQVTIDGTRHRLDEPFVVLATQNPLDHEGTYPLPEAQMDRFLLKVVLGYPEEAEEIEVYRRFLTGDLDLQNTPVEPVLGPGDVPRLRAAVAEVHVGDELLAYVRQVVAATRASRDLTHGASPRAALALLAASRAHAALAGRDFVVPDDIKEMALPALRHRLLPTAEVELEGRDVEHLVPELLASIEVPR